VVPIDRLPRSSEPVCQNLDLEYRILPLGHWYELVVTDARFQHLLEFRDLEMNQLRNGRIQRLLGLQPGAEQLEALAERGSDFERHPEATLQKGSSLAALLHRSGDCKKLTSSWWRKTLLSDPNSEVVIAVDERLLMTKAPLRVTVEGKTGSAHP
jgi:hypothetical protein